MGPDLVPVGGDGLTGSNGGGKLGGSRVSVIVARNCGGHRVLNGIARETL